MRISRLVIVSLIFTATILMLGCAASGPAFIKIETIPEQKGIVYLYRSKTIVGGAIVPPLFGYFTDSIGFKYALFFIILCYAYILWYGYKNSKKQLTTIE